MSITSGILAAGEDHGVGLMRDRGGMMMTAAALMACGADAHTGPGFQDLGSGGSSTTTTTTTTTQTDSNNSGGGGGSTTPLLGPPYPIVLAHGFFGFEDFAGAGFLSYFYGIKDHLADNGETLVFTPDVDPFNSSEVRGAQLAAKIQAILDETGHAKVNIVGHSQGGLDGRVVAYEHPQMVASVISLQAPHYGTPIADIALELVQDPNMAAVVDLFVQLLGAPIYDEIGQQTSVTQGLWQFSEDGWKAFNAKYVDQAGVYYASVAGRTDYHSGGSDCVTSTAPPWISDYDNELDPVDPLFDISEMILDGGIGNPYPNDGLLRVKDAKWGVFLGCLPADHLDLIGQLFGDQPGLFNDFDYKQFYVDLVGHIRDQGL